MLSDYSILNLASKSVVKAFAKIPSILKKDDIKPIFCRV